ncbi:MAG: DUF669 domain-containing protein [Candidatus Heimdallarchaeaceae archaeon]
MIKVNFSEVGTFEPIPGGVYKLQLVGAEIRESQRSEYPYINWTFEIREGDFQGRKIWHTNSLTPGGGPAYYLQRTLVALGVDPDSLKGEVEFPEGFFESLVGAECRAVIIQEAYAGGIVNKIKDFAFDSGQKVPLNKGSQAAVPKGLGPTKSPRIKIQ